MLTTGHDRELMPMCDKMTVLHEGDAMAMVSNRESPWVRLLFIRTVGRRFAACFFGGGGSDQDELA